MAIVMRGSTPCALCGEPVAEHDDVVATSHFVESRFDRFHRYSDVPFHLRCFLRWPVRRAFVARYNELARRRVRDGTVHEMRDDGAVVVRPAAAVRPHGTPSEDPADAYVALALETQERRPGIHVAVMPCDPLPDARLVISAEFPTRPERLRGALLLRQLRIGPVEHARAMIETGAHALPLRLLEEPPADFEHTTDRPAADALYVEAGDQAAVGGLVARRTACTVVASGKGWRAAAIRCWAIRRPPAERPRMAAGTVQDP